MGTTSPTKAAMYEYFSWYITEAAADDLAQVPCEEPMDERVFVGERNDDGWARWRPANKDEFYDFHEFEESAGIALHQTIKDYFNSFWFCTLIVEHSGIQFELTPVVPEHYVRLFLRQSLQYKENHDGLLDFIPIGHGSDGLLVVDNTTGQVCLEKNMSNGKTILAESLPAFLSEGE